MRGLMRWCVAMGAVGGLAGCHGAPWQQVAPTPDGCVQRSALKQEIAALDAKLKKGEYPPTPPVLMPATAAADRTPGGGISTDRVSVGKRVEATSASDGGASPQAVSNAVLANDVRVMDENAVRDRQTVANVSVGTAGSTADPNRVTVKQAAEPVPTTKPQAQARIRLLQKQLWDLPSGSACGKLATSASPAS